MSSEKHTPGPWFVRSQVGPRNDPIRYRATVNQMGRSVPPTLANARLIAAAPDLLAALESFLRAPSVGSSGPGSSTIVVQEFNLRAARAAIAKATGGAS